jgi:putative hydrolase of the HAD superfamily
MTVEAVSFDLDDTLFDYHEYARTGLASAADLLEARTGLAVHDELDRLYFDEEVTEGTFDAIVDRHDLPATLVDDLVDAFHAADTPLPPYPETRAVLEELQGHYRLGILTGGRGGEAKLRRLELEAYFDAVLVTPTIDASKPDRSVFERHLADLGVAPEAAVYLGDDPRVDFRAPNELGMTTVRLRRGRYTDHDPPGSAAAPDYVIDDLDEVPSLL